MSEIYRTILEIPPQVFRCVCAVAACLGITGNIVLFLLFSVRGNLNKLVISVYFRALALANLIMCVNWLVEILENVYSFSLTNRVELLCRVLHFLVDSTAPMSAWCLTAADIQQFIAIAYPTRLIRLRKPRSAVVLLATLFVISMLVYSHDLFDYNLARANFSNNSRTNKTHSTTCRQNANFNVNELADMVGITLVPFAIMLATSVSTLVVVVRSHRRTRRHHHTSSSCQHTNNNSHNESRTTTQRDIKFGITMISLNLTFLLMNQPLHVFNTINLYFSNGRRFAAIFIRLGTLFMFLNSSFYCVTLYLQIGVNSLVRHEFVGFFKDTTRLIQSRFTNR